MQPDDEGCIVKQASRLRTPAGNEVRLSIIPLIWESQPLSSKFAALNHSASRSGNA
jgi:hypothetical protein